MLVGSSLCFGVSWSEFIGVGVWVIGALMLVYGKRLDWMARHRMDDCKCADCLLYKNGVDVEPSNTMT